MKTFRRLLTAGAIGAFGFSYALVAQERPQQAGQQHTPQAQQQQDRGPQAHQLGQQHGAQEQHKKASDLRGSEVRTQVGDELGKVQEFAINLENGELAYLLVAEEEDGREWTPVPAQAVSIEEENDEIRLTVNIDQQRWEQAPRIQEVEIAQLGQDQRARQIYQFFGEDYDGRQQQLQFGAPDREGQQQQRGQEQHGQQQLGTEPGQQQEFGQQQQDRPGERLGQQQQRPGERVGQQQEEGEIRLSEQLMGARVLGEQQRHIGEISDLIFNVEEGRIDFVLMEPTEGEGTFAVAPQAFQVIFEDLVHLNASQQDLQQAQQMREQQIGQHAREARTMGAQARQDPQIYRFQEEGALFGAPGREREERN